MESDGNGELLAFFRWPHTLSVVIVVLALGQCAES